MKHRKAGMILILALACMLIPCISGSAAWKNTASGRKYCLASGEYVKSQWYQVKKQWYYFDKNGKQKTGRFKTGGEYYYVKKYFGKVCSTQIGNYYYGSDGKMVRDTWKKIRKHWFYFDKNGKIRYGRFETPDGKTYYCKKDTGRVSCLWIDKRYYDEDGVMAVCCWVNGSYVDNTGKIIKGNKNPRNPATPEEIRWLSAITYLEAGNQSYYGKKCVASVVMNRVNSNRFPNTIKDVLFQSGQFTPAYNGTLSSLYYGKKAIQSQCVKAAKYVLEHGSVLKGYYFFNTYSGRLQVGDHYFT